MPSWIKEKDGMVWFDEAYTIKQTNQSEEQLAKKAKAKLIRRFKQRNGGYWYLKDDVEALRESYLKRKASAKRGRPTGEKLAAKLTREWQKELDGDRKKRVTRNGSLGPGHVNSLRRHSEGVMLYDIEKANEERKRLAALKDEDSK